MSCNISFIIYTTCKNSSCQLRFFITLNPTLNCRLRACYGFFRFRPLTPKVEAELYIIWEKYQIFSKAAEKFILKLKDLQEYSTENVSSFV